MKEDPSQTTFVVPGPIVLLMTMAAEILWYLFTLMYLMPAVLSYIPLHLQRQLEMSAMLGGMVVYLIGAFIILAYFIGRGEE